MAYDIRLSDGIVKSITVDLKENVIEQWRAGTLENKILVKATGRNMYNQKRFLPDIHYGFCDFLAYKNKRKHSKVLEVHILCHRTTSIPYAVVVRNLSTALLRPGIKGLYELILTLDEAHHQHSGSGGLLYKHALYQDPELCADLRSQLGLPPES